MAGILDYSRQNPWVGDSLQTLSQVLLALGTKEPALLNQIPQMLANRGQQRFENNRLSRQDERTQKLFDMQVAEQERTLNKEKAASQAFQGLLGGVQPPNGMSQAQFGGAPTSQGILSGYSPEQASFLKSYGATDPMGAMGMVGEELFKDAPDAPKTVGGMQYNPLTQAFEPIPGYTEQAEAIARAGRAPQQPVDRVTWSDIPGADGKPIGQRSSTGQLNYFTPQKGTAKTLTPAEVAAAGFTPGAVVQQAADGTYSVAQKAPKDEPPRDLKPTELKELFASQEAEQAGLNAVDGITKALALSDKAASGRGAGAEALYDSVMNPDQAAATAEFENILTGQVLDNLKAVFGGNPTEGERAALSALAGSINQTRAERKATLNRAMMLAKNRLKFNQNRIKQIQGGDYENANTAVPLDNPDDPLGILP